MSLKEKVAYIRGMVEGMELDAEDPRNKVLHKSLELFAALANAVEELEQRVEENEDLIEALDSDLADVEEFLFEEDGDEEDGDELSEFEVQCPHCDEIVYLDEEELDEMAEQELEFICPKCNQVIFSDEEEETEQAPGE